MREIQAFDATRAGAVPDKLTTDVDFTNEAAVLNIVSSLTFCWGGIFEKNGSWGEAGR